jgi:hypothetical protein
MSLPISKGDFERGVDEAVTKTLQFLSENKDKAFTSGEISRAIGVDLDNTRYILGYLREKTWIKSRDIGACTYYIFQRMP